MSRWLFFADRIEHPAGYIIVRAGIVGIMGMEHKRIPAPLTPQVLIIISGGEQFILDETFARVAHWYATAPEQAPDRNQVDRIS